MYQFIGLFVGKVSIIVFFLKVSYPNRRICIIQCNYVFIICTYKTSCF